MEYGRREENQSPFFPSLHYSITPVLRRPRSPFSFPALALGCLLFIAPGWAAKVATTNGEYGRQLTAIRSREALAAASIAEEQAKITDTRQSLLDVEKRTAEVERTRAPGGLNAAGVLCEADSILGELELLRGMDRSRRDSLVPRLQARASALESSPAARLVGVREKLDRIKAALLEMRATRRLDAAPVDR